MLLSDFPNNKPYELSIFNFFWKAVREAFQYLPELSMQKDL